MNDDDHDLLHGWIGGSLIGDGLKMLGRHWIGWVFGLGVIAFGVWVVLS